MAERETCPACGHQDDREAFEGWEGTPRDCAHRRAQFVVRCPECEALHPDQTDHGMARDLVEGALTQVHEDE